MDCCGLLCPIFKPKVREFEPFTIQPPHAVDQKTTPARPETFASWASKLYEERLCQTWKSKGLKRLMLTGGLIGFWESFERNPSWNSNLVLFQEGVRELRPRQHPQSVSKIKMTSMIMDQSSKANRISLCLKQIVRVDWVDWVFRNQEA